VPETTEGTPVAPSSATQYTPLQEDWAFKPNYDVNDNVELVASIGKRQRILGAAKPQISGSHYLKPSGVEGQAPDYSMVYEAAFGTKTVIASEETLAAGSTASVLNLQTGHGPNVSKGRPVLVKDSTNGFSIRFVDSVATDAATLGFNLPGSPASGVKTGKPVYYSPAQSGHKTFTAWRYVGNGAAVEAIAGCRPTDWNYQAQAGGLINSKLTAEGVGYYFNPILITAATNDYIDFTDDSGTFAVAVAAGMYETPKELADAIATAMNASGTAQTYTVTYSNAAGTFSIVGTGTLLSLLFATGTNHTKTIATAIGFTATDKTLTAATTGYTGSAISFAPPQTPTYDSSAPIAAKAGEVMIGGASDFAVFDASEVQVTLTDTRTLQKSVCSPSGVLGSVVTGRDVKVQVKGYLKQFDVSKYDRFRENTSTKFQHSFGAKSGGQWVAGACGAFYLPTATITSFDIANDNGIATIEFELEAFVPADGSGEAFLGLL